MQRGLAYLILLAIALTLVRCAAMFTPVSATDREEEPFRKPRRDPAEYDSQVKLRNDIVGFAKKQLGSKYLLAGRDPKKGFDCSGLVGYVLNNFDINVSASSRSQALEGLRIDIDDARPGDLIFYKRPEETQIFHVSMVVENGRDGLIVIYSTSRGVVIDNITTSSYWNPKIYSARDIISDVAP
jgi:hypothetical protein